MTERCGFWQNGSCGREICLEVCRPASPSGEALSAVVAFHAALQGMPYCARSWNGFNVFGDEKSIKEVDRLAHLAESTLPWYQEELKRATKGTPAQPELLAALKGAMMDYGGVGTRDVEIAAWNMRIRRAIDALTATQPAQVDERAAFEALSLLLIEVELSGNGESTDFGWPRALAAARAALAAAPKPGESHE